MGLGFPVTIAGAGVFGLASALALAEAGAAVTVWDEGGGNASGIAAGMLAPAFEAVLDDAVRPHLDLLLAARARWPAFAARWGLEIDLSGAAAVGDDIWLDAVSARFADLGLASRSLEGAAMQALSPGLSAHVRRGVFTVEDWRIDAAASLVALKAAAEAVGVRFRAERLSEWAGSGPLVVATGSSMGLAGVAPELRGLAPIKGHVARVGGGAAGVVIRAPGVYAAPAGDGMIFGATMEVGVNDAVVDAECAAPLIEKGLALFPALADASPRISAGVRAATADGLPMVGASDRAGVFLAVGARRNGWLLAPLAADMVAACVTGRDPGAYGRRFDPARFGVEGQ